MKGFLIAVASLIFGFILGIQAGYDLAKREQEKKVLMKNVVKDVLERLGENNQP